MPLDLDPNVDKDRALDITLAGKQFVVCPLPLRAKIALSGLLPKMRAAMDEIRQNGGGITVDLFAPILDVPLIALKKAYPSITADDLLDLPIEMDEINAALPVIMAQAGGKAIASTDGDPVAGEAAAASPSKLPTGTDSSQTS